MKKTVILTAAAVGMAVTVAMADANLSNVQLPIVEKYQMLKKVACSGDDSDDYCAGNCCAGSCCAGCYADCSGDED